VVVHRVVNQQAPVVARAVAAVQVQPARPEALQVSPEVRQVKAAEPMVLQVPRAVRVAMAPYPRR
jgi:hypothetical protein